MIALCCGCSDGLGYEDNTKALLMTRGMMELTKFGVHFGAEAETFSGLGGFGDLVNTASPIHLKQDGLLIDIVAKFVKMDTENEDLKASGSALMYSGVHLKAAFGGTGFNSEVRHFPDFASRIYFMEKE